MEHFAGWKFCSRGWSLSLKSFVHTEELCPGACPWNMPPLHGCFVEPGALAAKPREKFAPAPISSRFLCPRPPLLLSAHNQNRHATQAMCVSAFRSHKKDSSQTWQSYHAHKKMIILIFWFLFSRQLRTLNELLVENSLLLKFQY